MRKDDVNFSSSDGHFPCPLCGEMLQEGSTECTRCDWVKGHEEPEKFGGQRDVMAAALSIIPGLGHVFKGHFRMGIAYFFGTFLVIFFLGPVGMVGMGFQLLLIPFYWLWVATHAYLISDLKMVDRYFPTRFG